MRLTAAEILSGRGYHAAETVISNHVETVRHTHEFYEIFITLEGEMYHFCNQEKNLLAQNTLCLVKPEDVHSFQKGQCGSVHFLNLAFSKEMYQKVLQIWMQAYEENLNDMKTFVTLPGNLGQSIAARILYLMKHMTHAGQIPSDKLILGILLDSFTFLKNQKERKEAVPNWLEEACHEMRKEDNYQRGLERFIALSGKSQEHLTRTMKKYYGETPSEFLNNIRLEQAALLLRTTEESVMNIMLDCGFNNVSYFNQRFKEKFAITPTSYRQFNSSVVNF